jgi:recombination protein RecA
MSLMTEKNTDKNASKNVAAAGERAKALDLALSTIEKQFGKGSIMRLGANDSLTKDVEVISTGSLGLDIALGIGGLPRGRIVEVFGPESSGKTTIALSVIAQAQKKGGVVAFVDAEHALDVNYAKKLGVNIEDLLISQPDTGEQALEITETDQGLWMSWLWIRWRPWFPELKSKAKWVTVTWDCRRD